jgi:hypothetical protein
MPGYVITAVFDVGGGSIPAGDVSRCGWGGGLRFASCQGGVLTLVVEVAAPDRAHAFEEVLSHAERQWVAAGGSALPPPSTLRVQAVVPHERVLAGPVGRGPDRMIAESAARVAARLRATRTALAELEGQWTATWSRWPDEPGAGAPEAEELRSLPDVEALLPRR